MAVPIVPLVPLGAAKRANGTKDTNGTRAEIDLEERIAMAMEGGVPDLYAPALVEELQRLGSDEGIPRRQ